MAQALCGPLVLKCWALHEPDAAALCSSARLQANKPAHMELIENNKV